MKWLKNLFYRAPEGLEEATKNAINRVRQSQSTPELDPLIASCGKEISDIIVDDSYLNNGTTSKIYFKDGTVLVIDSVVGSRWDKPVIKTTVKINKYTIEKGKHTSHVYKEVEA